MLLSKIFKRFPFFSDALCILNHGSYHRHTRQIFPSRTQVVQYSIENSIKMPGEICVLKYAKLSAQAHDPVRGSEYAAGFDLKR